MCVKTGFSQIQSHIMTSRPDDETHNAHTNSVYSQTEDTTLYIP